MWRKLNVGPPSSPSISERNRSGWLTLRSGSSGTSPSGAGASSANPVTGSSAGRVSDSREDITRTASPVSPRHTSGLAAVGVHTLMGHMREIVSVTRMS
jgi:hypothetical protein